MTETINFKGIDFEVEFDYQPYEAMVMYYPDGSGHPGCPEQAEISEINHKETDFMEFLEDNINEIEQLVLDKMHE